MKKVIVKRVDCPNGAVGTHHVINRIEIAGDMTGAEVSVQSWPSEASLAEGTPPCWNWYLRVNLAPDFLASMMDELVGAGPFESGVQGVINDASIEFARLRKNAEINAARLQANRSGFEFQGKVIASDELSRSDIDAVQAIVARSNTLPAGWPGAWKAVDTTFVPIADLETWDAFYTAMYQAGLSNFSRAQSLKALIEAATTPQEVEAINWDTDLTGGA
jgi:hypothetical protein